MYLKKYIEEAYRHTSSYKRWSSWSTRLFGK